MRPRRTPRRQPPPRRPRCRCRSCARAGHPPLAVDLLAGDAKVGVGAAVVAALASLARRPRSAAKKAAVAAVALSPLPLPPPSPQRPLFDPQRYPRAGKELRLRPPARRVRTQPPPLHIRRPHDLSPPSTGPSQEARLARVSRADCEHVFDAYLHPLLPRDKAEGGVASDAAPPPSSSTIVLVAVVAPSEVASTAKELAAAAVPVPCTTLKSPSGVAAAVLPSVEF